MLFWQQRIGREASSVLLYKFRTLRSPFDSQGIPYEEDQKVSLVGTLLRRLRLDELPQLFNVLVGDMSLVGPRPLLPEDQPANTSLRLAVRPGITGWAQVNGGKSITSEEKGALDDWYIRNATLWLDLRILALTIRFLFTGEKRSEQVVAEVKIRQGHLSVPATHSVRRIDDTKRIKARVVESRVSGPLEKAAVPTEATKVRQ